MSYSTYNPQFVEFSPKKIFQIQKNKIKLKLYEMQYILETYFRRANLHVVGEVPQGIPGGSQSPLHGHGFESFPKPDKKMFMDRKENIV